MTAGGQALFVGDIGLDTTVTVSHLPEPDEKVFASAVGDDAGGVVANAAFACQRAGSDARLLCVIGNDPTGDQAVSRLQASAVAVNATVVEGATCRALVLLEPAGEKRLILIPGVSMYPRVEQVRAVPLDGVTWVHTAPYDYDAAALLAERCRDNRLPWSVDLEPATFGRDPSHLAAVLTGAAVVFINVRAARALGEKPAAWLFDRGVQAVILSRGPEGAVLMTPTQTTAVPIPSEVVGPVVDTTGAGDCLAGWFIAETLAGLEPIAALGAAVTAASLSCGRLGAQVSYPDRNEFRRLLVAAPVSDGNTPLKGMLTCQHPRCFPASPTPWRNCSPCSSPSSGSFTSRHCRARQDTTGCP